MNVFLVRKGFLSRKDGGFEPERSVIKAKAKPLRAKPAQDAPGSAEAAKICPAKELRVPVRPVLMWY
jgi:hypothetical protein